MKAEKMPMASTASVIISALDWMKKLAMPATSSMIAPMNSHLPMADRSRLMTDDSVAMPRKIAPVPAKAVMIRLGAVGQAEHRADQARQHQAHEEGEGQQHRHAGGRVLGLLDREHEAEGAAQEHDEADAGRHGAAMPVATPIQAPSTVGTIDSASSQ